MLYQIEKLIEKKIAQLVESKKISFLEAIELQIHLGYFAFNLTCENLDKSDSDSSMPNVIDKERALLWVHQILPPKRRVGMLPLSLTNQEKQKAYTFLQLAEESNLVFQTECLVGFVSFPLQHYFCAKYCDSQYLDEKMLSACRPIYFEKVWVLWSEFDSLLISKLFTIIQTSTSKTSKIEAITALGYIKSFETTQPLLDLFQNRIDDEKIQCEIVQVLGVIKDNRTLLPILNIMLDENEKNRVREYASTAVSRYAQEALPYLLEILANNASTEARRLAIKAMYNFDSRKATSLLVKALTDEIPQIRRGAVAVLGQYEKGNQSVFEAILSLINDPNEEVRSTVVQALSKIDQQRAIESLIDLLKVETSPYVLFENLPLLLGRAKASRAIPVLLKRLNIDDEELQDEFLGALKDIGSTEVINGLYLKYSAIDANQNSKLKEKYLITLAFLGDKRIIEPLYILSQRDNEKNQFYVTFILARLHDQRVYEKVVSLLKHPDWMIRSHSARALGDFGDKKAVKVLEQALKDEKLSVRSSVALALSQLKAKEVLLEIFEVCKYQQIDEAMVHAIFTLGDKEEVLPILRWIERNQLSEKVRLTASSIIKELS
jgi:HEAT repeat protein